jgi:hypothetical protein
VMGIAGLAAVLGSLLLAPPAPGSTVSEQRARLPPAAECNDPVAGVWKSHNFNDEYSQWSEFTLEIERDTSKPGALRGRILNHSWQGGVKQVQPPPDCSTELRYEVSMDAIGHVGRDNALEVTFGGIDPWRLDRIICGTSVGFGYNLDNFTGTIDPDIQEFQSVNNDGGIAVNEPTVFRRIRCYEGAPPADDVPPPPFQPPGSRGCLGW